MNKTEEQLLFTLKPDELGQENFENDYTTLTDVEFNLISPVAIEYDKKSEIVTRINEINNELDFINGKVEELNLEIDNLTNHADGLDYTFAVISGIIAGIVDSVFIGEWNFEKAKTITNKEINGKVLKFAKKDARYASWCKNTAYGRKERDPNRLETAIEFLEEHYHLPGDSAYQTGNYGVTGNAHRLDDFCHHPTLIGLLCSVIVQFTGSTVYSHSGELIRIPISVNRYGNFVGNNNFTKLMAGVINWFISAAKTISNYKGHLMSDIATSTGIPGPLLSTLKELSILPCLKDKMFCENLRKVYQNGIGIGENQIDLGAFNCIFDGASNKFDKRAEMAVTHELKRQSIPIVINEAMVRGFYFIRRFIEQMKVKKNISQLDWKLVLPLKNRTITRMITISTGTLMAFDLADAGIRAVAKSRGVNPKTLENFVLSVNFVGIGRFAVAVTTDVAMGVKKNVLENERIILQCKKLNLLNAKVAYEQGEVYLAAIETEEEMEKLFEIANNAKRIFCDAYNNIDTNINSMKSLVKSIDKNNLKTYANILES